MEPWELIIAIISEHKNPAFPDKLFKIILKIANHGKEKFKNKEKCFTKSHSFPFYESHIVGIKVYVNPACVM